MIRKQGNIFCFKQKGKFVPKEALDSNESKSGDKVHTSLATFSRRRGLFKPSSGMSSKATTRTESCQKQKYKVASSSKSIKFNCWG